MRDCVESVREVLAQSVTDRERSTLPRLEVSMARGCLLLEYVLH